MPETLRNRMSVDRVDGFSFVVRVTASGVTLYEADSSRGSVTIGTMSPENASILGELLQRAARKYERGRR